MSALVLSYLKMTLAHICQNATDDLESSTSMFDMFQTATSEIVGMQLS